MHRFNNKEILNLIFEICHSLLCKCIYLWHNVIIVYDTSVKITFNKCIINTIKKKEYYAACTFELQI